MKIRLTILTENNRPRPNGVTEEQIAKVWQETFNALTLFAENNDKATVEKVEFLADGGRRCGEDCGVGGERMRSCETCRHTLGGGYCFGCNLSSGFHKWEPKPMTNADRIRSMNDEELAAWLAKQKYRRLTFDDWLPLCNKVMGPRICHEDGCEKCWLDWLKSPVDEEVRE